MLDFLHAVASDKQLSELRRVDALFTLRHADGLGPLRELRDNPRVLPATRRRAAIRLRGYTVHDRAISAQVLALIAADPTVRPALRWRAVQDLAEPGTPGRDKAAEALRSMATD